MKITLYKMDATGTVREWTCEKNGTMVICTWGQMKKSTRGWDPPSSPQSTQETFPTDEQACSELESLVRKKRFREGYTSNIPKAVPFLPMLAQNYEGRFLKEFYVQPKLDGFRCIANNSVLRSRQNTIIRSIPHINEALKCLPDGLHLDGELYIHGVDLQTLSSYIKRETPHFLGHMIQYHVYDAVMLDTPYYDRKSVIYELFTNSTQWLEPDSPIKVVPTMFVACPKQEEYEPILKRHHDEYARIGFEGLIIRDPDGMYELDKRSPGLLKYKTFVDGEFEIVQVNEAKNRCATFTCKARPGVFFDCTPKFTTARKQQILRYKENYIGKWLQVKYSKLTPDGKPFHPIGINIFDKKEDKHG